MSSRMLSLAIVCFSFLLLASCTQRLADYTVISTKNVSLHIDKSEGVRVQGQKSYFLGIGWNLQDAVDEALESAGVEYDLLVDGVLSYTQWPFVFGVKVEGIAIRSSMMKKSLGDAGYKEWLECQDVFNPNAIKSVAVK